MLKSIIFAAAVACAYAKVQQAVVVLNGGGVDGVITFTQTDAGVKVEGSISGLITGTHGFHVHNSGDLRNGCTSAGAHFNPSQKPHGSPDDADRHVGDLGNIVANSQGLAIVNITDKLISLDGANSIVGRAVVVHADADDLGKGNFDDSKTTGHAGGRVVCGVIGIVSEGGATGVTISLFTLMTTLYLSVYFNVQS